MKLIPYILLLALCGCVATKQVSIDPRMAEQPKVVSQGNQGADVLVVVQPSTITITWCNNNVGDDEVITGLQASIDLVNWATIFETNCVDETNSFTMQKTDGILFLRAYNRI